MYNVHLARTVGNTMYKLQENLRNKCTSLETKCTNVKGNLEKNVQIQSKIWEQCKKVKERYVQIQGKFEKQSTN